MLEKDEDAKISRGILVIRSKSGSSRIVKIVVESKRGNEKNQIKCRFLKYVPEKPKRSKIPILIKNYNKENIDFENFKTKKITESAKMSSDSKIPILKKLSQTLRIPKKKTQWSLSNVRPDENPNQLILEKPKCEGLEQPYMFLGPKKEEPSKHIISKGSSKKSSLSELIGTFKNVPQCSSEDTMPLSEIEEISTSYKHSSSLISSDSTQNISPEFSQSLPKSSQPYHSQDTFSSSENEELSSCQQSSSIEGSERPKVSIFKQLTSELLRKRISKKMFHKKSLKTSHLIVMAQYESKKDGLDEEEYEGSDDSESDSDEYHFRYIDSGLRPLRSEESKLILDESNIKRQKRQSPSPSDSEVQPILSEIPSSLFEKRKSRKTETTKSSDESSVTSEHPEEAVEEHREPSALILKEEEEEQEIIQAEEDVKQEEEEEELKEEDFKPSLDTLEQKDLESKGSKVSKETSKLSQQIQDEEKDIKSEDLKPEIIAVQPSKDALKKSKKSEGSIKDLRPKDTKSSVDLKKLGKTEDDEEVLKPKDVKPTIDVLKKLQKFEDVTFTVELHKKKEDFCVHTKDLPTYLPEEFSEEQSSKDLLDTSGYPTGYSTTGISKKHKATSSESYNICVHTHEVTGSEASVYSIKESSPTAEKIDLEQGKQVLYCQPDPTMGMLPKNSKISKKTPRNVSSDSSNTVLPRSYYSSNSRSTSISSISQDSFFCDFNRKKLVKVTNQKLNVTTFPKKSKSFTADIASNSLLLSNKERRRIKSKSTLQK